MKSFSIATHNAVGEKNKESINEAKQIIVELAKKDFLFRNFSLSIENNLINCIKGFNGAGKTTLSQILLGNLEPSSGEILVDGSNLNKLSLKWWKTNVAYIPQNPNIVNSSIYDNILFGNERLNEQEVSRLLQSVGLDKMLKRSSLTISDNIDKEISKGI